jgi:hypothetical protein
MLKQVARCLVLAAFGAGAAEAQEAATIADAVMRGTPILEFRPRFEEVRQTGRANEGEAFTLRTHLGWQTGKWADLQGLIEFEDVRSLGAERYDSGVNGGAAYGQIFDPEVTELNRLQLSWKPSEAFSATLGRQRINLGDQRFIGSVGWRQDEQTFDALRLDSRMGAFEGAYIYVAHVNRIFGEEQDWGSDSHVADVSYAVAAPLKLGAFGYALDFDRPDTTAVRNQSSLTWGLRVSGRIEPGGLKLDYSARWARQREYGSSVLDYDLDYASADVAAVFGQFAARIGFEQMEGDGARGFATPLATLHAFNGWSDAFLANGIKTTADGLRDLNVTLTWSPDWKWGELSGFSFLVRRHEFEADRTGAGLGAEWNLSASGALSRHLFWLVKYADYDGPGAAPAPQDRTKFWLSLEWRL